MPKFDLNKARPVEAFKHLLVYEPRRYYYASWSHFIMQLMPYAKMTVVQDFHTFAKALANPRHEFTTIIVNWDLSGGYDDRGAERLQAIRGSGRYQETPICIFSETDSLSSKERFQIGEFQNIIMALNCPSPVGVLRVMRGKVDPTTLCLLLGDEVLAESENLLRSGEFLAASEKLRALAPAPRLLIRKYLLLMQCYVALENYELAKNLFEELMKLKVHSPSLFRMGSEIYKHLGNPTWSLQFAEIRYRAYPSNGVAVIDYARGLLAHGRRAEATELLQKESQRSFTSKAALYSLLIEILGQDLNLLTLSEVLKRLDCEVDERTAIGLVKFAVSVSQSGNSRGAVTLTTMMLPYCKTDVARAESHYHLARCLYISGDIPAAVAAFCQSLIIGPWSDKVARSLHTACSTAESNGVGFDIGLLRRALRERMEEVRAQLGDTLEPTLDNASVPYELKPRTRLVAEKGRERLLHAKRRAKKSTRRLTA